MVGNRSLEERTAVKRIISKKSVSISCLITPQTSQTNSNNSPATADE